MTMSVCTLYQISVFLRLPHIEYTWLALEFVQLLVIWYLTNLQQGILTQVLRAADLVKDMHELLCRGIKANTCFGHLPKLLALEWIFVVGWYQRQRTASKFFKFCYRIEAFYRRQRLFKISNSVQCIRCLDRLENTEFPSHWLDHTCQFLLVMPSKMWGIW